MDLKPPDKFKPIEEQSESTLLAMLAWGEARNQGTLGMLAVVWVALNRSATWSKSVRDVVLQPWQFSCFNANDPNRAKLLRPLEADTPSVWATAVAVVDLALSGHTIDPTVGATHYATTALWGRDARNPDKPKWFEAPLLTAGVTIETARHGDHVFGKTA